MMLHVSRALAVRDDISKHDSSAAEANATGKRRWVSVLSERVVLYTFSTKAKRR